MSYIVAASNEGSHYLKSGEHRRSIEYLTSAFEKSRQQVLNEAAIWKSSSGSTAGNIEKPRSSGIVDVWMDKPTPNEDDLDSMYIYTRPIIIPSESMKKVEDDVLLLSVMVSFNLALAFLESAREDSMDWAARTNHLRQSLRLFQYSFRLQRARGKTPQSPLFFMATVNNIGVLYASLGEIDNARECFQQLLALLMYMNTNAVANVTDYGAFLQNTTAIASSTNNVQLSTCVGAAGAA